MDSRDIASPARRDFITQAAWGFVGVGSAAALWPFIDQMNPNPATPPPQVTEVDLGPVAPGQAITVMWRGQPIVIRHRTREEVQRARETSLGHLPDRFARNAALPDAAPATDANRTKQGHERWLVVVGLCTHLNCRLISSAAAGTAEQDEAWFCPCHAARFDLSGRVVAGPARTNLPVPPYRFLNASRIRIG